MPFNHTQFSRFSARVHQYPVLNLPSLSRPTFPAHYSFIPPPPFLPPPPPLLNLYKHTVLLPFIILILTPLSIRISTHSTFIITFFIILSLQSSPTFLSRHNRFRPLPLHNNTNLSNYSLPLHCICPPLLFPIVSLLPFHNRFFTSNHRRHARASL